MLWPIRDGVKAGVLTQPGKATPQGKGLVVLEPDGLYVEPLNPTVQQSLEDRQDFRDVDAFGQNAQPFEEIVATDGEETS